MRRWMAAPALFAALAVLAFTGDTPQAQAQPAPPIDETFLTADGVKLHGLFHRSGKAREGNPVALLMYAPGPDKNMTKGDWDGLAKRLNEEGFHVFRFDWRGHGKSTDISNPMDPIDPFAGFWTNRITGAANNAYVKIANKKQVKNDLFVNKDFGGVPPTTLGKYFPVFVQDLAAVRLHLDQKNDEGVLNTSSIYVIGEKDTAALGLLWLTAEWNRPAVAPTLGAGAQYKVIPTQGIVVDPPAGADIAACIWLSASRPSNTPSLTDRIYKNWILNTLKIRDNNPMLFLYGPEDKSGGGAVNQAKFYFDEVLVAGGKKEMMLKPQEQTFHKPLADAKALNGVNLLGNNAMLKTEDTLVQYIAARHKDRESMVRKERKYVTPYYVNLPSFYVNP